MKQINLRQSCVFKYSNSLEQVYVSHNTCVLLEMLVILSFYFLLII